LQIRFGGATNSPQRQHRSPTLHYTSHSKPEPERVPIADALPGIQLHKIDDAQSIDFVFALVKYRDSETTPGDSNFTNRACLTSSPPNREELLGALTIQRP